MAKVRSCCSASVRSIAIRCTVRSSWCSTRCSTVPRHHVQRRRRSRSSRGSMHMRCIRVVAVAALACGAAAIAAQSGSSGELRTLARQSLAQLDGTLSVSGLREPVEVIRDRWGVPHIYARNTDDLFFAQGYVMGQDRLWQMEMWRRQREGRLSEILGPETIDRDRVTRLLMHRGPFDDREWTSNHPEGKRIFTAFVNGLNAYITQNSNNLPVEFKLTGIKPSLWTPETALLRSATMGDANSELQLARLVARVGV